MSMIKAEGLTFAYPSSYDNIFENVNFQIDTDWKLGFVGRNGRGKTTFLNLLLGKYDYKGKIIFLNFWATWCPPCRAEMPEIQEIYEEYGENASEVAVLGIAGPNYGREGSVEEISAFLSENGYTYPVVMDEGGMMAYYYGISAYPTTFMIDKDGNVYGYVTGQITKDIMKSIIEQTINGK